MEYMQDRLRTLKQLSELPVFVYTKDENNYFVFGEMNKPVKTVCTYPKAKLFAEGVAFGKRQNERENDGRS